MTLKYFVFGALLIGAMGCGEQRDARESDAQRALASARDLEEELTDLPQAIARYGEIATQFPQTEAAKKARSRQAMLERVQTRLADRDSVSQDSTQIFYEAVVEIAPDYFAALKKLGTNYSNQLHLNAPLAARMGMVVAKDHSLKIWAKQDSMWSRYAFRPIPSNRFWQDQLCKDALKVTKMLIAQAFRDYDRALAVINRGLDYASGKDVISQAKVYAAYCTFWQGRNEDLERGIALANEALSYEFLSDNDRTRAYHVIGLCHRYLYQDSKDIADLDAAIKALNEAVNIDGDMGEVKELLKEARQQKARETKPQRSAARPPSKSSGASSVRASGKLTQTGTGASSGLFYIVLDDRVQCFFSNAGLAAGRQQMKRFQKSSAMTLIVSGTDRGTMPLSGQRRLDNCRIVDWR